MDGVLFLSYFDVVNPGTAFRRGQVEADIAPLGGVQIFRSAECTPDDRPGGAVAQSDLIGRVRKTASVAEVKTETETAFDFFHTEMKGDLVISFRLKPLQILDGLRPDFAVAFQQK